jgi:hypothetical protein
MYFGKLPDAIAPELNFKNAVELGRTNPDKDKVWQYWITLLAVYAPKEG